MRDNYKIGMIGLGSIGTKHLYNLKSVMAERNTNYTVDLIRSGIDKELDKELVQFINKTYYSYENVPNDYDVLFITNPTHMHFDTIKKYVTKTKHMFIEKPVTHRTDININELNLLENGVYYVACPLRYTGVIQYLKQNCNMNKVFCARVICSSYLPDWRPNLDYRTTYSAHKEQGGGVSLDLIHEWDYLSYLFGVPEEILNIRGKYSRLEINSDDLSLYIAKYKKMAVEVHLDYFGRKTIREIQLFTDEDTIVGDIVQSEIRYLKSGKTILFKEKRNEFQRKEIAHFFDILEGKKMNDNDIITALRTLKFTEGAVSK